MPSHIPNLMKSVSTVDQRAEYAAGLRALADWVETTEFPVHYYGLATHLVCYSDWYEDEDFVKRVGSAARLIGGFVKKGVEYEGGNFHLLRSFGGDVGFRFSITRKSVCSQTEEDEIVEEDVPVDEARAAELKAELEAMETTKRKVVKTKTVYVCPPSLLELEA